MSRKDSITISPKHGVNPEIPLCFFCHKPKNEILLPGVMKGDMEAPHNAVWDRVPCDDCAAFMKDGIILISVENEESGDNPYRTGSWCVVKDSFFDHVHIQPLSLVDHIKKARVAFLPDDAWDMLPLPPRGKAMSREECAEFTGEQESQDKGADHADGDPR